jgi:hypothetical protein
MPNTSAGKISDRATQALRFASGLSFAALPNLVIAVDILFLFLDVAKV